jgi:hypothetical protein
MTDDLFEDILSKLPQAIRELVKEHKEEILQAIAKTIEQKESGKIKVTLSFTVNLFPMGDTCAMKIKLSFGEKTKAEVEITADATPILEGLQ